MNANTKVAEAARTQTYAKRATVLVMPLCAQSPKRMSILNIRDLIQEKVEADLLQMVGYQAVEKETLAKHAHPR